MVATQMSSLRGQAVCRAPAAARMRMCARSSPRRGLAVSVHAMNNEKVDGKVVGIDLGTTKSVVAVMQDGKPTIIPNAEGGRTTPSVVAFTADGVLVGQAAKLQAASNPENTFTSFKHFMGSYWSELGPEETEQLPYKMAEVCGDTMLWCPHAGRALTPEEVSGHVLRKLVDDAAAHLGEQVDKAVVSVPVYFNDVQRHATKAAGKAAGLQVLRLINEPTAAILAHTADRIENRTVMVFDLGGGNLNVTVVEAGDGVFEVLSHAGFRYLGGIHFDRRIVDYVAEEFKKTEGIDLREDKQALQRLIEAAEQAKIELSSATETTIRLPAITTTANGTKDVNLTLTRAKFDELCHELIERCKIPMTIALRDARMCMSDVQDVLLVGGSSRIPAVAEVVRQMAGEKIVVVEDMEELVAKGAAVQAGLLTGEVAGTAVLEASTLSLGVETLGGIMFRLIPRSTELGASRSDVFSTAEDGQTSVTINILQGEREYARENKRIGTLRLDGIPPAPRGEPQIEVTFRLDQDGQVVVTAKEQKTGKEAELRVEGALAAAC